MAHRVQTSWRPAAAAAPAAPRPVAAPPAAPRPAAAPPALAPATNTVVMTYLYMLTVEHLKQVLRVMRIAPGYMPKKFLVETVVNELPKQPAAIKEQVVQVVEAIPGKAAVGTCLRALLNGTANAPPLAQAAAGVPPAPSSNIRILPPPATGYAQRPPPVAAAPLAAEFEPSRFYEVVASLSSLQHTVVSTTTTVKFQLTKQQHALLYNNMDHESGQMHRVLLLSASSQRMRQVTFGPAPIELPRPSTIRLFNKQIQMSSFQYRKPTHQAPFDLAKLCDKLPCETPIDLVVAMSTGYDMFGMRVCLVRCVPFADIIRKISASELLSNAARARRLAVANTAHQSITESDDVMAVATEMSLSCPVGLTRLATPAKGAFCTHQQCFDLMNYLSMNARTPNWTCPICNKALAMDQLIVDVELDKLLKEIPKDVTSLTIEADGKFRVPTAGDSLKRVARPKEAAAPVAVDIVRPSSAQPQLPMATISLVSDDEEDERPVANKRQKLSSLTDDERAEVDDIIQALSQATDASSPPTSAEQRDIDDIMQDLATEGSSAGFVTQPVETVPFASQMIVHSQGALVEATPEEQADISNIMSSIDTVFEDPRDDTDNDDGASETDGDISSTDIDDTEEDDVPLTPLAERRASNAGPPPDSNVIDLD